MPLSYTIISKKDNSYMGKLFVFFHVAEQRS